MRRTLEAEEAVVQMSRLIKGYKEGDSAPLEVKNLEI